MKTISLLLIAVLTLNTATSQKSSKPDKLAASTGRFYGRIIDASSNKGLASASVQLIRRKTDKNTQVTKDIPVDGMLTLKNGDFNFDDVPLSQDLLIVISALGFKSKEDNITINHKLSKKQGIDADLGNIRLHIDLELLQTVTVTAEKPYMSLGIDRKIFNVERSLTAAGGTAEDVMRSVPSLSVDIDGNVTLRNSSPQVFIDGRPTTMTLEQIPADAMESVEIITNPSSKFDASGSGGILNIVLKKNRKAGYNGSLKTGIDQWGKYSLGGDINIRQKQMNVFLSSNYRQRKSVSTGRTDRQTVLDNGGTHLYQADNGIQEKENFYVRGGFDYLMNNRNTITVSGFLSDARSSSKATTQLLIDTMHANGKNSSFSQRLSFPGGRYLNNGVAIGYKHLYPKTGKEWTADINYASSANNRNNIINTSSFNLIGGPISKQFSQLTSGNGATSHLTFQTDYANPLTENSKIEFGARIHLKAAEHLNSISYKNGSGEFGRMPQLSSDYTNSNRVFAAYGSFSKKINKFGYQLALRVESSRYSGDVTTAGITSTDTLIHYGNKFPISFFPSLFLTKPLGKEQQLQFSITRRINRPDFWQLFPVTDFSDSLNLSRGNPGLRPEFTYATELAYEKTFSAKNIFLASAFLKYSDQLITPFQQRERSAVTGKENLVTTFINARSSYTGGLEFIYRQSLFTWWEMTGNLNLFTSGISFGDAAVIKQKHIYSWFTKLNNIFKLPMNFSLEITSEYNSKRVLPQGGGKSGGGKDGMGNGQAQATSQGFIRPRLEVDAALRYDFLKKKKASIILHVSDMFRTDANNIYSESIYFSQNNYRLKDPQYFRIHFTWRFGKFDTSLFKRKNNKVAEDQGDDSEQ